MSLLKKQNKAKVTTAATTINVSKVSVAKAAGTKEEIKGAAIVKVIIKNAATVTNKCKKSSYSLRELFLSKRSGSVRLNGDVLCSRGGAPQASGGVSNSRGKEIGRASCRETG